MIPRAGALTQGGNNGCYSRRDTVGKENIYIKPTYNAPLKIYPWHQQMAQSEDPANPEGKPRQHPRGMSDRGNPHGECRDNCTIPMRLELVGTRAESAELSQLCEGRLVRDGSDNEIINRVYIVEKKCS